MKAIAGGNLAGFPTELVTVYVECEIIGEKADMTVLEYIMTDAKVIAAGAEESAVRNMLTTMGFGVSRTAAAIDAGVGSLSGGWRMKLALSRAMLLNPDMLLLDEVIPSPISEVSCVGLLRTKRLTVPILCICYFSLRIT
jgi:elongation factor 3